jgi:hypothetical protein
MEYPDFDGVWGFRGFLGHHRNAKAKTEGHEEGQDHPVSEIRLHTNLQKGLESILISERAGPVF